MAITAGFLARLRAGVARAATAVLKGLTVWSVLAGLGILPTAAAAYALIRSALFDEPSGWMAPILVVALVVNIVLALLAIRGWRYARDLESDMELIGEMWRKEHEPAPPWLPSPDGALPITNAVLEELYDSVLSMVRTAVGSDAEIGVGWISLSSPMVSFNGFSVAGQKDFSVWAVPGRTPKIVRLARSTSPRSPIREPYWRRDPTWQELIQKSWLVESPFEGNVTLWPRHVSFRPPTEGEGWWEIEYSPVRDQVVGRRTMYCLVGHELQRLPLGTANPRQRPAERGSGSREVGQ